jgi:transposase
LPESVRSYICCLEAIIQQQQVRIQQLEARVHELEARLSKNSSNSSKPPGGDGFKKKTKSLRGETSKKQGAQQGHVGKGLAQVNNPDQIITHTPSNCQGCGCNLYHVDGACIEKR